MSVFDDPLEVEATRSPRFKADVRQSVLIRAVRVFVRPRGLLFVCLSALTVGLLAVFAVVIANSQAQARRETEKRFAAQASISAALTESLFTAAGAPAQEQAAKAFGGETVDAGALAAMVKSSQLAYVAVLNGEGRLLGASAGTPASVRGRLSALPVHVRSGLGGHASLSSLIPGSGGALIEWALPFKTRYGPRVEVRGMSAGPIAAFIGAYLSRLVVGQPNNEVLIVDRAYRLIGSADPAMKAGKRLDNLDLRSALASGREGVYRGNGVGRVFAAAPIGGSSWRVVVSTPRKSFYPALADSRRWVIWGLFAAFVLALIAGLYLLRQALRTKTSLAETNSQLVVLNATLEQQVAERTRAAERRAAELAHSNAELEQFGYVASHDLQEPLRKIQAFGDRLEERYGAQLDADGRDYLRRMQEAATRSRSLINDLLSLSRVTSRAGSFEPVELTALANETLSDLEIQIKEAGGRVEVGELPRIEAEPSQIRRLLQNLVGNALKFRREGEPPLVRVQGRLLNGDLPARCELTIEDNGIGFDEQYLERIFTIFQRLHSRTEYEGTGIGLAICKKIVQHHGGAITARSRPGMGSTFVVTLPVDHPQQWSDR